MFSRRNRSAMEEQPLSTAPSRPSFFKRKMNKKKVKLEQRKDSMKSEDDETPLNALSWLQSDCPTDVLPKVLAFMGPRMGLKLSKTNRFWRELHQKDSTWKVLCQELYKWSPENDEEEPLDWKDYYCRNPCVPVDYSSVEDALALAQGPMGRGGRLQDSTLCILLRPGRYHLQRTVTIRTLPGVRITLKSVQMPSNIYRPAMIAAASAEQALPTRRNSRGSLKLPRSARQGLLGSCRGRRHRGSSDEIWFLDETSTTEDSEYDHFEAPSRARLFYRSNKPNEPAICVRQGSLSIQDLEIVHMSPGADLWNGNAAVHIQPPLPDEDDAHPHWQAYPMPNAKIQGCKISSRTGRGVVSMDGASVVIQECALMECAATGLYVGGPGSRAVMEESDILGNGIGAARFQGIARGHSGIYIEQGWAQIRNCSIRDNVLTGISAVSPDSAILELRRSDLIRNGRGQQIEVPPHGTRARRASILEDNVEQEDAFDEFFSRSGLVTDWAPRRRHRHSRF